jgi:hypothetical protein
VFEGSRADERVIDRPTGEPVPGQGGEQCRSPVGAEKSGVREVDGQQPGYRGRGAPGRRRSRVRTEKVSNAA